MSNCLSPPSRVYHKTVKAADFTKIETKLAWLRMTNLKPSSQHVLYVEAVGERATSLPSETLVAWTDPALPAFVDVICLQLIPCQICLLQNSPPPPANSFSPPQCILPTIYPRAVR